MISALISRIVILLFGTLYPAYASYKAVRTKNVKEYVKWMMYWIVFALFTCAETFTDLFLSFWFPFYYEIKVVIVIWLLSPATKGSSILYRNFVHPALTRREQEIDEYISKAKEQGYHTMLHLGSKGVTYATNVIMQTAIKGGGGIVNQLRRSYSLSDLSEESDYKADLNRNSKLQGDSVDTTDAPRDSRTKTSRKHINLYFPEVDVDVRSHHTHEVPVPLSQIRSNEDISSGYSSAEPLFIDGQPVVEGNPLMRTASVGAARTRPTRGRTTAQPKKALTEAEQDELTAHQGWQQSLPPSDIASFFPMDPSGLHPQAFPSPEALQLLFTRYFNNGTIPFNTLIINEQSNEDAEKVDEVEVFEVPEKVDEVEVFQDAEKDNFTDKNNGVIKTEEDFINSTDKPNSNVELEQNINNKEDDMVNEINSELKQPSDTLNEEINLIEPSEHLSPELTVDSNPSPNLTPIKSSISKLEDVMHEHEQADEYFEDAQDNAEEFNISVDDYSTIASSLRPEMLKDTALDENILISIEENISDKTQKISLNPTMSLESVDSGNDLNFEDSLPDVTLVTRPDSPTSNDRKGKYNKVRAPPPPPDVRSENVVTSELTSQCSASFNTISEPDISVESTTLSHNQVLKLQFLNDTSSADRKDSIKHKEVFNISKPFETREISPSPSQGKKDSSQFSRFLPKSGMASLFNLWGPKEDNFDKIPTKTSPIKDMFYTPPTSKLVNDINYSPEPESDGHTSKRNEQTKTGTKLKIRQMSQSPSRNRRQYNF